MYSRFARRLTTQLNHNHYLFPPSSTTNTTTTFLRRIHYKIFTPAFPKSDRVIPLWPKPRFLSTRSARHSRGGARPDIGAKARQLQSRRLWTYAITFGCIAGFIVIVINQFQDQLVFYVTPTDALTKYTENPSKTKFRLGGLVLEGSVADTSSEIEFVITDLITDMLVRYQGSLPDLFREGHSVVVEGFIRPYSKESDKEESEKGDDSEEKKQSSVSNKAKSLSCYFKATEVLAKHDEKYMPPEVASAIEKNKKVLEEQQQKKDAEKAAVVDETTKG